jgi:hypothetical protein
LPPGFNSRLTNVILEFLGRGLASAQLESE